MTSTEASSPAARAACAIASASARSFEAPIQIPQNALALGAGVDVGTSDAADVGAFGASDAADAADAADTAEEGDAEVSEDAPEFDAGELDAAELDATALSLDLALPEIKAADADRDPDEDLSEEEAEPESRPMSTTAASTAHMMMTIAPMMMTIAVVGTPRFCALGAWLCAGAGIDARGSAYGPGTASGSSTPMPVT